MFQLAAAEAQQPQDAINILLENPGPARKCGAGNECSSNTPPVRAITGALGEGTWPPNTANSRPGLAMNMFSWINVKQVTERDYTVSLTLGKSELREMENQMRNSNPRPHRGLNKIWMVNLLSDMGTNCPAVSHCQLSGHLRSPAATNGSGPEPWNKTPQEKHPGDRSQRRYHLGRRSLIGPFVSTTLTLLDSNFALTFQCERQAESGVHLRPNKFTFNTPIIDSLLEHRVPLVVIFIISQYGNCFLD